jgi:protocatechuate 3,4-dioxygenase beta subunit
MEKVQNHSSDKLKNIKLTFIVFTVTILSISLFLLQSSFAGPTGPIIPPELSATEKNTSTNATCSLEDSTTLHGTPQQIEGPYFVDGMPDRSNITSDTSNGSAEQGIPLRLMIHVYGVTDGACVPIEGAKVDIWHANSQGIYSGVNDMGTSENNFLRGYQITDKNGTVQFRTVYPGWYEGRAIHIHDKVRISNGEQNPLEWTSQLYLNNSINEEVHAKSPYSDHGLPEITNEQDMVYSGASADGMIQKNSGELLMISITKQSDAYFGTFDIVLNASKQD